MATNGIKIQRPVAVHVQIENYLREQIRSGVLKAGDKLPTAPDLAAQLGVHVVTVQKALRRLKMAGILHRTPRVGTFIRSSPQNAQIGIFFGIHLSDESAHFFRAVSKELQALIQRRKQKSRVYDDINTANSEATFVKLPSYQHYLTDREHHIFEGIVVIGSDIKWIRFLKETAHLPIVSGTSGEESGRDVCFDWGDFARESISHLASRGRKRILYLRTVKDGYSDLDAFYRAVREHNFEEVQVEQLEMHVEHHYREAVACECIESLVSQWNRSKKMPDALLVSDDIAMRGAALALARHRIKVPEAMEVVTWANEGIQHHYGIPVTKYEVSPRQFAQKLFDLLCVAIASSGELQLPATPSMIKGCIVDGAPVRKPRVSGRAVR